VRKFTGKSRLITALILTAAAGVLLAPNARSSETAPIEQ